MWWMLSTLCLDPALHVSRASAWMCTCSVPKIGRDAVSCGDQSAVTCMFLPPSFDHASKVELQKGCSEDLKRLRGEVVKRY